MYTVTASTNAAQAQELRDGTVLESVKRQREGKCRKEVGRILG